MKDTIQTLLKGYQPSHTQFQIDNFIIGNQGCDWSQYKQVLREIDGRYKTLIDAKEGLKLFDLKIIWRWPFGRVARLYKYGRKRNREAMVESIAETERELKRFVELAIKLKEKFGEIDEQKRAVLEADSWRQKALRMAGIDLLVNGRIGQPTMELILALPKNDRVGVLQMLAPDSKPDPMKLIDI
jgi:hypothetical protein